MIIVIGASGFLGPALRAAAPAREMLFTHCAHPAPGSVFLDVRTSPVEELVRAAKVRPRAALVLAGITNVDACARDPAGTAWVNVEAIKRIIDELRALSITPVFTSSDAVFDGSHGMWTEEEPVAPILTYGKQKREVERYLGSLPPPWLAVRLPKLISANCDPRCMVTGWLQALAREERILCATDNFFTPADVSDAGRALLKLVDAGTSGLYHVAGPERISRRELLQVAIEEYARFERPKATIVECSLHDIPVLEPRPLDTSMDTARFRARVGAIMRPASEIARLAVRHRFRTARA
jgi:dTDP-4-dehydrorhamnose reductase